MQLQRVERLQARLNDLHHIHDDIDPSVFSISGDGISGDEKKVLCP